MFPSLPSWSGQLCCSKHCSILSALLPEPSVSSSKGAALSPQIFPAFCVGCWCIGLAATLVWESFWETPMLTLYGNLLDKMSNSGGRQLLSILHQVPGSTYLSCTRDLIVLALCAACSSEQLQQPASLQISGGDLGMQWQTSKPFQCWGNALVGCLLKSTARYLARWGNFPPSLGKKGEKPGVGTSFKSKAASSPCTCEGSAQ